MSSYPVASTIHSRFVKVKDLNFHVLEAGEPSSPLVVLLHGFPELSFSWRHVIPFLADRYHVVAPDQRGYGLTATNTVAFEDDLTPYGMLNLVDDIVCLISALGHDHVDAIIGHDFGSLVSGFCVLTRPDLFDAVVHMSAPFAGVPPHTFSAPSPSPMDTALAALNPPRKHLTSYYTTSKANRDMHISPEKDLRTFLRNFFYVKSGDWEGNKKPSPHPINSPSPGALAILPHYYIMPLESSMPDAIAADAPPPEHTQQTCWLTEPELDAYMRSFSRTGFQGPLNWYRALRDPGLLDQLRSHPNTRSSVTRALFIAGALDWGVWQTPGAVDRMREVYPSMRPGHEGVVIVPNAGHWVQQERAEEVNAILGRFLAERKN